MAIKSKIYKILKNIKLVRYVINRKRDSILLIDTPIHGNLGDQAIVLAELECIKENTDIKINEISARDIDSLEEKYASFTPMNKVVFVHGGGFLGMLWPDEEERFRRILKAFHKQKIIVFPQTITFDIESESGQNYLMESQKIYSEHLDLTIFVREKKSFEIMEKYFPTVKSILVPDIVTILQPNLEIKSRKGILFCLRADLEKQLTQSDTEELEQSIKRKFPTEKIKYTDTVIDQSVHEDERKTEVYKKLEQFSEAKLVITDRLHGMIFSLITGTPCIALGNSNGKVLGVYEWIKECEYIKYVKRISEVEDVIEKIDLEKTYTYDNKIFKGYLSSLTEIIREN